MNKDQVEGRVDEALGKLQKNVGRDNADPDTEADGQAREIKGKIQKTFGDVKRDIGKAIDR